MYLFALCLVAPCACTQHRHCQFSVVRAYIPGPAISTCSLATTIPRVELRREVTTNAAITCARKIVGDGVNVRKNKSELTPVCCGCCSYGIPRYKTISLIDSVRISYLKRQFFFRLRYLPLKNIERCSIFASDFANWVNLRDLFLPA